MVTYLSALRCAVNVEHALQTLQGQRFSLTGDTGSRALPPLIPLLRHRTKPDPAWLDEIRRAHTVKITESVAEPVEIPPARISLADPADFAETQQQIVTLQRALAELPEGDSATREFTPEFPPEIVISWKPEPGHPSPIELPETSAFWLSVFELVPGNDPWWEYLTWSQIYCRRLRAQSH
ncbi:MAG: hypothetical protein WD492_14390 [Alkalispirochaeta sp.]